MVDLGAYIYKYLNTYKLHLRNCLLMLKSKNYMSNNMHLLLRKDYVLY